MTKTYATRDELLVLLEGSFGTSQEERLDRALLEATWVVDVMVGTATGDDAPIATSPYDLDLDETVPVAYKDACIAQAVRILGATLPDDSRYLVNPSAILLGLRDNWGIS